MDFLAVCHYNGGRVVEIGHTELLKGTLCWGERKGHRISSQVGEAWGN